MSSPADELHALLDERDAEIARLREALDKIAAWPEGAVVQSYFDEPVAAAIARAALAGTPLEEKP